MKSRSPSGYKENKHPVTRMPTVVIQSVIVIDSGLISNAFPITATSHKNALTAPGFKFSQPSYSQLGKLYPAASVRLAAPGVIKDWLACLGLTGRAEGTRCSEVIALVRPSIATVGVGLWIAARQAGFLRGRIKSLYNVENGFSAPTCVDRNRPRQTTQAFVLKAFFRIPFSFDTALHCLSLMVTILHWQAH